MCAPSYPGPLDIHPGGRVPYVYVLIELAEAEMEEAGQLLRQTVRGVRAWMEGAGGALLPGGRVEEVIPELSATLPPLFRIVREEQPTQESFEAVGLACMHVATWAERSAARRTALAFLKVAEDADPENPHYAYHIGRLARSLAMYDTAEAWHRWAHWVARGQREWRVAALSLSGLGNLHRQRGNLPLATRFHRLAWRVARRHNLRTLEGDALYDLAGLSFDFGDVEQGTEYTRLALAAYGPGHGRVFTLARDIAWMWMDRFGQFESAAHVFNALLDHIWEPPERILLLASLTRAAAGAGWKEVFEAAWNETWAAMRQQVSRERHAAVLTQLALGASRFGHWERACLAAEEALSVAQERGEGEMIFLAESILETARGSVIVEERVCSLFSGREGDRSSDYEGAELATELTHAMRVRADDAPSGPARTLPQRK